MNGFVSAGSIFPRGITVASGALRDAVLSVPIGGGVGSFFTVRSVVLLAAASVTEETWDEQVLKSPVPVLVDYWAPWCGPCRMIAPLVDEISEEYGDRVRVVSVLGQRRSSLLTFRRPMSGKATPV